MKNFNLYNEIISPNKNELLTAINTKKEFGITYDSKVVVEPFAESDIFIFKGFSKNHNSSLALIKKDIFKDTLGDNFDIVDDGERVLIKASKNWQEIIKLNSKISIYDDTTADGIAEFQDKQLEDIGWHATEFNIKYRELVNLFETECKGILLCIEQQDPYIFSGLGFITDLDSAREIAYNYCHEKITKLIAEDEDFKKEKLHDDEIDAAQFFKVIL